MLTVNWMFTQ